MEKADAAKGEDVNRLVNDLASTLQRTLAQSPQVAHCLSRIQAEGYEVSVALEATIGFNRKGARDGEGEEVARFDIRVEKGEPARLKMTPLDRKFLRSLKISVEEEEE